MTYKRDCVSMGKRANLEESNFGKIKVYKYKG